MPILVTGASGSGKTSFASVTNAVDLDRFGFHTAIGEGSHGFKWIISPKVIPALIERGHVIHAGICNNVFHPVTVSVEESQLPFDDVTYDAISEYYDKIIFLWYDPTDEEFDRRFSDDRDNPYGKDPETQAKIKDHLERIRGQTEFDGTEVTVIDVTGIDLPDLVTKISDEINDEVIMVDPYKLRTYYPDKDPEVPPLIPGQKCALCGHHLPIDQTLLVGDTYIHADSRICLALQQRDDEGEEKEKPDILTPTSDEDIADPEKHEGKAEEICVICGKDLLDTTEWHAHFDRDRVYEGTICMEHFSEIPPDAYPEIREKAIELTRHPEWFPDNRPNISMRGLEAWAVENDIELSYTHDELVKLKELKKQEYLQNQNSESESNEDQDYVDQTEPWKL